MKGPLYFLGRSKEDEISKLHPESQVDMKYYQLINLRIYCEPLYPEGKNI